MIFQFRVSKFFWLCERHHEFKIQFSSFEVVHVPVYDKLPAIITSKMMKMIHQNIAHNPNTTNGINAGIPVICLRLISKPKVVDKEF